MRPQPRRNHPAVIRHQKIIRSQKPANFTKTVVFDVPGRPLQYQQPAAIARVRRLLRDEALWKFVVKKVCTHRLFK